MLSRGFVRVVATVVVTALVSGCAEFDRRGGIVDYFEDTVFFKADTKSHRLLRSYLLATVLLTAARRQGQNDVDRTAIAGALEGALAVANEAYVCLYPGLYAPKDTAPKTADGQRTIFPIGPSYLDPKYDIQPEVVTYDGKSYTINSFDQPRICQFFDERMARLDYALYRLAGVTLFNEEARQTLGDIRSRLIGKIPVLSDAAVAAIHANKAINQASTILDDLLNLAFNSFGPSLALLPLYRDSIELNMWVIADTLRLQCAMPKLDAGLQPFDASAASASIDAKSAPCDAFRYEMQILRRGNGNLKLWQDFTRQMNAQLGEDGVSPVEAYRPHFLLVSQLLVRSCRAVLSDASDPQRCEKILVDALEHAAFSMDNATGQGLDGRQLLASAPLPGARLLFAQRRRPRPADVQATGSIPPKPATAAPQAAPNAPSTSAAPAAPAR